MTLLRMRSKGCVEGAGLTQQFLNGSLVFDCLLLGNITFYVAISDGSLTSQMDAQLAFLLDVIFGRCQVNFQV